MNTTKLSVPAKIIITLVLSLIAVTILLPLIFMVLSSFKDIYEYLKAPLALPKHMSFKNYVAMFSGYKVMHYVRNSAFISVVSLVLCLCAAIPAAYAFAKLRFRFSNQLYVGLISLMMIPVMVVLIPRYVMFSRIGLINNHWSLILSYFISTLPYTLYLLTSGFRGIPTELIEAARMDGASFFDVVFRVVAPVGSASIITVSIINFVNFWNEIVQAMLYINSDELRTITAVVSNMGNRFISNMPFIMTGLTITSIPTIAVYIFFERYLQAGLTMGAVK